MEDKMSVEIRADGSLHIEGYVNAIERDSNPLNARGVGECVEQVKAGAFGMALRSAPNVDMLLNHDRGHKLAATSEGTLELREDSIGLKAVADITDEFVISKAKSGLLRGWSFGFRATDQEIEERSGKIPRRIIKSMDLFEVSVIDDTHTPCYNGCSLEYRADMVDDYEIRSTENGTVVGAESATATEETAADTSEERGVSAKLLRMQLELMEMEARYNHYHDPHNGRFASGAGGGAGLYYSMGKGKGEIIGASSRYYNINEIQQMGKAYGMNRVGDNTVKALQEALNGSNPVKPEWGISNLDTYSKELKRRLDRDKRQEEKFGKSKSSDVLRTYRKAELKLVKDTYKKLTSDQMSFF